MLSQNDGFSMFSQMLAQICQKMFKMRKVFQRFQFVLKPKVLFLVLALCFHEKHPQ